MDKIFFSYTLKDGDVSKDFLINLKTWANNQGLDTYIDILDNDYNEKEFQIKLESILKKCDSFCIIESKMYNDSKWTQKENQVAKENNLRFFKFSPKQLRSFLNENSNIQTVFQS